MTTPQTVERQDARQQRPSSRVKHLWKALRQAGARQKRTTRLSTFGEVTRALFPHSIHDYPGDIAGVLALLNQKASRGAVRKWMSGERKPPKWALELIIIALERRKAQLEHVRELAKKEAGL